MPFPFVSRARYEEVVKRLDFCDRERNSAIAELIATRAERHQANVRADRLADDYDMAVQGRHNALNRCSELVKVRDGLNDKLLSETQKREKVEAELQTVIAERDTLQQSLDALDEAKDKSNKDKPPMRTRPTLEGVKSMAERAARGDHAPVERKRPLMI